MRRANDESRAADLLQLLACLEELSEVVARYNGSVVEGGILDRIQTGCWDLEEVCARFAFRCAACGASTAEDWLLAFQSYGAAMARAIAALKAAAWVDARGDVSGSPESLEPHCQALRLAAAALAQTTVRLANVCSRIAEEAADEAVRARPELVERFVAVHTACASSVLTSVAGTGGLASRARVRGEC